LKFTLDTGRAAAGNTVSFSGITIVCPFAAIVTESLYVPAESPEISTEARTFTEEPAATVPPVTATCCESWIENQLGPLAPQLPADPPVFVSVSAIPCGFGALI
jgi:hypothetical protein